MSKANLRAPPCRKGAERIACPFVGRSLSIAIVAVFLAFQIAGGTRPSLAQRGPISSGHDECNSIPMTET